ncbi:MAG: antitoxin [Candidatus Coatesbacteria bacterium]
MTTAKVFTTGRSQAVRLPKEYRFNETEVSVNKIGDLVVLYPKHRGWEVLERSLAGFSKDFMVRRDQPRGKDRRATL